ncbi:hypothetical protein [Streptomyces echinatus]|uniref:hypothetical protein n=1 Tax=Streptomyces echinatus TaxID=67293 RepID=UPI0037990951
MSPDSIRVATWEAEAYTEALIGLLPEELDIILALGDELSRLGLNANNPGLYAMHVKNSRNGEYVAYWEIGPGGAGKVVAAPPDTRDAFDIDVDVSRFPARNRMQALRRELEEYQYHSIDPTVSATIKKLNNALGASPVSGTPLPLLIVSRAVTDLLCDPHLSRASNPERALKSALNTLVLYSTEQFNDFCLDALSAGSIIATALLCKNMIDIWPSPVGSLLACRALHVCAGTIGRYPPDTARHLVRNIPRREMAISIAARLLTWAEKLVDDAMEKPLRRYCRSLVCAAPFAWAAQHFAYCGIVDLYCRGEAPAELQKTYHVADELVAILGDGLTYQVYDFDGRFSLYDQERLRGARQTGGDREVRRVLREAERSLHYPRSLRNFRMRESMSERHRSGEDLRWSMLKNQ